MASRERDKPAADLLRRSLASTASAPDPCPDPEILAAYSERSLDADESARYELHFSNCARCREQLAAMVRADESAGAAGGSLASPPGRAWLWDWRWLAPVAAALAIAAVLVARRPAPRHPSEQLPQPLVAMTQPAGPPTDTVAPESAPAAARAVAPATLEPAPVPRAKTFIAPSESVTAGALKRTAPNFGAAKSESASPPNSSAVANGESLQASNNSPSNQNEFSRLEIVAKPAARPKADAATPAAIAGAAIGASQSATATSESAPVGNSDVTVSAVPAPIAPAAQVPRKTARTQSTEMVTAVAGATLDETAQTKTQAVPVANNLASQNDTMLVEAGDETSAQTIVRSPDPRVLWRFPGGRFVERSSDAGATWHVQWTNPNARLIAGTAPSSDSCWIVGRGGIVLLTTDGKKWKRVAPPAKADFVSVAATDASSATVTSADSRKFTTSDGGKHWTPAP